MKNLLARKFSLCAVLFGVLSAPAFAIFDAEAGIGYSGFSYTDNGSPASIGKLADNNLKGFGWQAAAHLNFSIPALISFGVGPYIINAPGTSYSGTSSGVTYNGSIFSVGGEVKAKLLAIPGVSPYIKGGIGSNTITVNATVSGVSIEALKMTGIGYKVMGGLEIGLIPTVFLFLEAGVLGASLDATVVGISGLKASGTGFQAFAGVGISL